MIYIYFLALLLIAVLFVRKTPKWDPRLAGARLESKGLVIFLAGIILGLLAGELGEGFLYSFFKIISIIICLAGFITMLCGFGRHAKGVFGPIDPRREADPGYDLEYIQCPHCKKAKMRKETKVVTCPICKKKTRIEDF